MSAVKETPVALPGGKEALQENEKKWGPDLMKAGWTVLPNMIFMRQRALGLDSMDINILLILLSHWWTAESLPFPSKKTIAEAIGCDTSTVRRRIQAMEAAGLTAIRAFLDAELPGWADHADRLASLPPDPK